jgi:hypothetical protein
MTRMTAHPDASEPAGAGGGGLVWDRPMRVELLDGDAPHPRLRWTWAGPSETAPLARGGPGLLEDFADLVDAPAPALLRFARQWGVLTCCAHGLPVPWRTPPRRGLDLSVAPGGPACR